MNLPESWAEKENNSHSCLDEENRKESSIEKGATETDESDDNIQEVSENESWVDEKGGEAQTPATGEDEPGVVREKQIDDDFNKVFQTIQGDTIIRKIGIERYPTQPRREEDCWGEDNERIPTLEELAGLAIDEITER